MKQKVSLHLVEPRGPFSSAKFMDRPVLILLGDGGGSRKAALKKGGLDCQIEFWLKRAGDLEVMLVWRKSFACAWCQLPGGWGGYTVGSGGSEF